MSAFSALRRLLRPNDVTVALPADPFIAIDRQKAIESLRLDERAKRNGSLNFPPPDAAQFDDVELEIIAEMAEHARRAQMNASENDRTYAERLSELALLRELSTISAASQTALGDYRTTIINRRNRLTLARDAIRESYRELAVFKLEHALTRPAHTGLHPLYAWSAFIISWFFESALNTLFLRVNDPYGVLGGFIAAAVISAVNIGLSALVGHTVWRYLRYRKTIQRRAAQFAFFLWLTVTIAWNFLAAHFRDAKASGQPNPEAVALGLFVNSPFQLETIYSYGLLIAGIAFACIAAYTAFRMDDPYPGYGSINQRHLERTEAYSDEIELALQELKATRDEAIDSASSVRDELQLQFRERGQIIAAREAHRNRYVEHQDYLETVGNALLSYYRSANVRTRSDRQTPATFGKPWYLSKNKLPNDTELSIDAEVARAEQHLRESIETINGTYLEAIGSFDHLDTIKRSFENE
jgi:hypothetical protein